MVEIKSSLQQESTIMDTATLFLPLDSLCVPACLSVPLFVTLAYCVRMAEMSQVSFHQSTKVYNSNNSKLMAFFSMKIQVGR